MQVLKISQRNFSEILEKATTALKRGRVLICPSDTVYGLICRATDKKAVERVFKIKKRVKTKPIGLFVKDIKMAKKWAWIDARQEKFLKKFWPGKFTAVLKSKKSLSGIVFKGTVGLRIPGNKFLLSVLERSGCPLAQTSANISGRPASTKIKEALKQFQGRAEQPDLVLDAGDLEPSLPSTVIDLISKKIKILRKG
jgi:L-threonylcarbamoyladenylate synthase